MLAGGHERSVSYGFDDGERQLAEDLAAAVSGYAALFRHAARIAAEGATADELAEWSAECFEEAISLRLLEADSIGFSTGAPEDAGVLVRDLYESLVVLSGVTRVAHALSMPVSTCADGVSLASLLRERGELSRWYAEVAGRPLAPPDMPDSLVPARTRATPSPFGFGEGRQLAANADRELDEEERSRDLNDVFAGRIAAALQLYGETVSEARDGPLGDDLRTSLAASARTQAPALIGFARLVDRRTVRLDPPPAAPSVARLLADGFVTLAAAETPEDIATLPYASTEEIEDAARPLRNWLTRLGTV
jgi:hypothetical protein